MSSDLTATIVWPILGEGGCEVRDSTGSHIRLTTSREWKLLVTLSPVQPPKMYTLVRVRVGLGLGLGLGLRLGLGLGLRLGLGLGLRLGLEVRERAFVGHVGFVKGAREDQARLVRVVCAPHRYVWCVLCQSSQRLNHLRSEGLDRGG